MLSSKPLRYLKVFSQFIHLLYSKKSKSLYLLNEKVLSCLQKIRLTTISKGFVIMSVTLSYIITILLNPKCRR